VKTIDETATRNDQNRHHTRINQATGEAEPRFTNECTACDGYGIANDPDIGAHDCKSCEGRGVVAYLGPVYLNVYAVQTVFGGREEGGWHYDVGEPLESRVLDPDDDETVQTEAALVRWHADRENPSRRTRSIGGIDIVVYIEPKFAQPFPQERPRYE
jgi:hypothetical protein